MPFGASLRFERFSAISPVFHPVFSVLRRSIEARELLIHWILRSRILRIANEARSRIYISSEAEGFWNGGASSASFRSAVRTCYFCDSAFESGSCAIKRRTCVQVARRADCLTSVASNKLCFPTSFDYARPRGTVGWFKGLILWTNGTLATRSSSSTASIFFFRHDDQANSFS